VNSRLRLIGLVVSLIGSLGLAMYGAAVAGSLDVLLISDESRHSAGLTALPAAVFSIMALVVGLVIARVVAIRLGSIPPAGGHLLAAAAGLLLVAGGGLCGWSVAWAQRGLMLIGESVTAPKPEEVDLVIRYAEPFRAAGAAVVVLSALLSLVAGLLQCRTQPFSAFSAGNAMSGLMRWASIGAAVIIVCLAAWTWHHGSALQGLLAEDMPPKPVALFVHLQGILKMSLLVFAGFGVLGLLGLVADLFAFFRAR